jgi:WXG100 family type VII secretion target
MGSKVQLNYDDLGTMVKKFRDEGEDVVKMHSSMRDRVHDLHKDWVGEGADKFFGEMENDLLPALTRLSGALFYAQDVLHRIIKTIQTFDEDTARFFKLDSSQVNQINLGAFMAGAGLGVGMGGMAGGSLSGGSSGLGGSGVEEPSGAGQSGVDQTPAASEQSPDLSAGQTGSPQTADSRVGAGAGGSGGFNQGFQDNMQDIGAGVGVQVGAGSVGGPSGGGPVSPDHIYDSSSSGGTGASSTQQSQAASSAGGGAEGSAGGGAVAAGVAGVAGAAAVAGAAKSIKGRLRKKKS